MICQGLAYEMLAVFGIFLHPGGKVDVVSLVVGLQPRYAIIVADIANISIQLCEFKVLCTSALKQASNMVVSCFFFSNRTELWKDYERICIDLDI